MNQENEPRKAKSYNGSTEPTNRGMKDSFGYVSFLLSIVSLFCSLIPYIGWILWGISFVVSLVGLTRQYKGFSITAQVICAVNLVVLLLIHVIKVFYNNLPDMFK